MEQERPQWLMENGSVSEVDFCEEFIREYYLVYWEGALYGLAGRVEEERQLKKTIYNHLRPWVKTGIAKKVEALARALRLECTGQDPSESVENRDMVIHVANGKYDLRYGFIPEFYLCRYRLPVNYNPEAPEPKRWLAFLSDLLEPEDILTLQEYMGYCLVPSTRAQKMLLITGRGGEGKSRIGVVMKALLGINMNTGSIAKVEMSPFARADLQHLLVMVDDDLKMEALSQTNYLKSIITAEIPMDLERKGIQSYQGSLNVRFLAFGNGSIQALYDRSRGFFRRQIILSAKERPAGRVDDRYLSKQLLEETEGILLWCIRGLERLIANNYCFTESEKCRRNLRESILRGDNVPEFLSSEGYIQLSPEASTTSKKLCEVYNEWCADNSIHPLSNATFLIQLAQNAVDFGLTQDKNIPCGGGRRVRGYRGIRVCPRFG